MITPTPDMIAKIAQVFAVVAAALQGIKQFAPQLKGNYALAVNGLLSLALSFSVTHEINLQFLFTAIIAAVGASGVYHLVKMAGGTPAPVAGPVVPTREDFAKSTGAVVPPIYWDPAINSVMAGEIVEKDKKIAELNAGHDKLCAYMAAQMEYSAGRETAHQNLETSVANLKAVDIDHLNGVEALNLVARLHAALQEAEAVSNVSEPVSPIGGKSA
jgi:hypothetical protein